jgi:lipoate-protein ligase B
MSFAVSITRSVFKICSARLGVSKRLCPNHGAGLTVRLNLDSRMDSVVDCGGSSAKKLRGKPGHRQSLRDSGLWIRLK